MGTAHSQWIDGIDDSKILTTKKCRKISLLPTVSYDIDEGLLLEARRLTFAQNVCERIGSRCIKIDGALAHMVNNVIKARRSSEIVYARNLKSSLTTISFDVNGSSHAGRASNGGRLNLFTTYATVDILSGQRCSRCRWFQIGGTNAYHVTKSTVNMIQSTGTVGKNCTKKSVQEQAPIRTTESKNHSSPLPFLRDSMNDHFMMHHHTPFCSVLLVLALITPAMADQHERV